MGITQSSLDRINRYLQAGSSIFMIGCQNLYNKENYGQVAHGFFEANGHSIRTIDITGCQGAEVADLREDLALQPEYDIVADFGSKEHVDGALYQPFKNIHEACKSGGVMIHENPATGNWPGHGQHYFTIEFYESLSVQNDYELLDLCQEPAMGNITDGWNVCAVLRKTSDSPFMTEAAFNKIYKKHIHAK